MLRQVFAISLLTFIAFGLYGQARQDIYDLIESSDYIFTGNIIDIQQLEDEKYEPYNWFIKSSLATIEIDSLVKGSTKGDTIQLYYINNGGSHIYPAKLEINTRCLGFVKYDSTKHYYVLPFNRFSIVEIYDEGQLDVLKIIDVIKNKHPSSHCEYFDLLMLNIEAPTYPVLRGLNEFIWYNDSIQQITCIDEQKRKAFFEAFEKNRIPSLLDYTFGHRSDDADKILIEEIHKAIQILRASTEKYKISEMSTIVNYVLHLSYIKEVASQAELDALRDYIYFIDNDDKFIKTVKDLIGRE